MECSSTTLWADHRLAVRQNHFLTPISRLPHSFLLFSLISLPIYLFALAPDNIWAAPLFGISLFLAMHFSAATIRELTVARLRCQGRNDSSHAWLSGVSRPALGGVMRLQAR